MSRLVLDLSGTSIEFVERSTDGAYRWLIGADNLLIAARATHIDGYGGESANMTARLDNSGRQASELLGYPLRARAWFYDDAGELEFEGLVQAIDIGPTLALTLEAGDALLLTEKLPLRSTKALGDFSEDTPLPIPFGDLTSAPFPLIRLTDIRYLAADVPMGITKVFTERQQVYNWARKLEADDDNHTWTVVEFDAPVPQGFAVSACGTGKINARTGDETENPGDVFDLIDAVAGNAGDWSDLRAETSALDLRVAGRLAERVTIQQARDAVAQSIGAIQWHGGARLYPTAAEPSPILDLLQAEIVPGSMHVAANLTDTADVLRLAYDVADASERPQQYIELTASPKRYGGLAKEVVHPYLRSAGNAEAVGRPALQRLNGERYDVGFTTSNTTVRAGMWVRPLDHPEWMVATDDPVIMVLSALLDRNTNAVEVKGETIVGQSTVTLTAHSIALPDEIAAAIDVSIRDGVATFTITDKDGKPLKGARISLDGSAAKTADAQGKVRFPAEAGSGQHEVAVSAPGYVDFTLLVGF